MWVEIRLFLRRGTISAFRPPRRGGTELIHRERVIPYTGPTKGKLVTVFTNYQVAPPSTTVSTSVSDVATALHTSLDGYQITDTESHPEWLRRDKRRFRGDIGGPFFTTKRYTTSNPGMTMGSFDRVEVNPVTWPNGKQSFQNLYSGFLFPLAPQQMSYPTSAASSAQTLDQLGATAIARCSPSNSSVDLAVSIGELFKEGIPKTIGATLTMWKGLSSRDRRRAIGGEYLNVEFGWKPLVNDIMGFAQGVVDADDVFRRYAANSGKMVRRSYDFPEVKSTAITKVAEGALGFYAPSTGSLSNPTSPGGIVYRTDTVSIRRWFRGAFTYYVPPASDSIRDSLARAVIMARKTFGLSLTPDTLWNLAPWSWGVDWFSNTGDVLSNWTDWAIDNQVLLYGYVMEHCVQKRTYTYTGPSGFKSGSVPPDVTFVLETKVRRQATPYGFGLKWDDLSFRQQAIIAALGISRSP